MRRQTPTIVVIAGPTASGKTDVAVRLAERIDGELIGADSIQVYRGLDIGSAKPTDQDLRGTPHHLIDVLDPEEGIDAAGYARLADRAIADVRDRGRVPIVVGGAGLWLRALLRGLVSLPPPDPNLRQALTDEAQNLGSATLHRRLLDVDPASARAIHPHDALRVVRALEVFEQTGQSLSRLREAHALGSPRYHSLVFVSDPEDSELTPRIERRIAAMIARGWVEETRRLVERFGSSARALRSVGYRQLVEHLEGDEPFFETLQRIRKATRTYARRQRTWFRSEPGIDFRGPTRMLEERLPEIQAHVFD